MRTSVLVFVKALVAALFEEPKLGGADDREAARVHPALLLIAGLALAAMLVTLATLAALGLDALLHLDVQLDSDAWGDNR
jgi:hypothetical protein